MSATPTLGESEQDNSSSLNVISSLLAEKGTGTADDEIETSSIEALNWSEADEEELQQQQHQAAAAAAIAVNKKESAEIKEAVIATPTSSKEKKLSEPEKKEMIESDSTLKGGVLSTSLLESINSTTDSNDESTKKSVIENWASGVKDAVDRGEMEIQEERDEDEETESSSDDSSDDDTEEEEEEEDDDEDKTVDQDGGNNENVGMRKRRRLSPSKRKNIIMSASTISTSTFDDPLSSAPVLDEGPIWNKGIKLYQFHENRRINQKLTIGLLIAIVLAIGLGLGNLVAVKECESEFKSSQIQQKAQEPESLNVKPISPVSPILPKPSTDTAEPFDAYRTTFSQQSLPLEIKNPSDEDTKNPKLIKEEDDASPTKSQPTPDPIMKKDEPMIDPSYTVHMETLSKIVKTLDNLQRKIDKFENTTRQLGGVIMLKETEEKQVVEEEPFSYEEEVYPDIVLDENDQIESTVASEEEEDIEDNDGFILDLIDGIEETIDYMRKIDAEKDFKEMEKRNKFKSRLFTRDDKPSKKESKDFQIIEATIYAWKNAQDEFIRRERDELRERKILGLNEERKPEDYSQEEKDEVKRKYDIFMKEYPFKQEVEKIKQQLSEEEKHQQNDFVMDTYQQEEEDYFETFEKSIAKSSENEAYGIDSWARRHMDEDDWNFMKLIEYQEIREKRKKEMKSSGQPVDEMYTKNLLTERLLNDFEEFSSQNDEKLSSSQENLKNNNKVNNELVVEPKKEMTTTTTTPQGPLIEDPIINSRNIERGKPVIPSEMKTFADSLNNFSKGDEDKIDHKRQKRDNKVPKKEYPKENKPEKKKKKLQEQNHQDAFEGRGSGRKSKSSSRGKNDKENSTNDKNWKKSHNNQSQNENDKENNDKEKQNNKKDRKKRSDKDYKESNNNNNKNWKDYDYDGDDDDHKRKKYSANKDSSNRDRNSSGGHQNKDNPYTGGKKKEQDNAWLQERAKSRENQRLDSNSKDLNSDVGNNGGKKNNWQMERDQNREKVRSKNGKKVRYDD